MAGTSTHPTDTLRMVVDEVGACWATETLIVNITGRSVSKAGWDAYVDFVSPTPQRAFSVLTIAPFASPNATQRAELVKRASPMMRRAKRVAVCSESVMARAAITAMTWLTLHKVQTRAFSVRDLHAALDWLAQVETFARKEVEAAIFELFDAVGLDPAAFALDR